MQISHPGLDLIKKHEGLRTLAYFCPRGIPSIGYGTTQIDGLPIKMGTKITPDQAEDYLRLDVRKFEKIVDAVVQVPINQEMFDALMSFVYNLGEGNLKASTLLKFLNKKMYVEAISEFKNWNKAKVDGKYKELPGLTARRADEESLFRIGLEKLNQE